MVTGANRHDSVGFEALVDAIPSGPDSMAVREAAPTSFTRIRGTTLRDAAGIYASGALLPGLLAVALRGTTGSASIAG